MSCCGQKRQAWREWPARNSQPSKSAPPVLQNPSLLYHLGESSLLIKGAVTGHTYLFAGRGVGLTVDERDMPTLLATGRFAPAPPEK